MTAKDLRQKTFDSISREVELFEKKMLDASKKGELKIYIEEISEGARAYFKEKGFEVKLVLNPESKADNASNKWAISW